MITVTESAQEQVNAYFKENSREPRSIRIFINSGCGGEQLSMALDKERPNDSSFTFAKVEYIIETNLLEKIKPVTVDFTGTGFKITAGVELGSGCSSCSSCGSGGCG